MAKSLIVVMVVAEWFRRVCWIPSQPPLAIRAALRDIPEMAFWEVAKIRERKLTISSTEASVVRLVESEKVPFADNSFYQPILAGEAEGYPIFTGIQTAESGYETPPHQHPYLEVLHILDGEMEAWLVGSEGEKIHLSRGDTITLPPNRMHVFRAVGDTTLRLLGTHLSAQRIVEFGDGSRSVMGNDEGR